MLISCSRYYLASFIWLITSSSVHAVERVSVFARLASDQVYHGISESSGNPSIGVNIEVQLSPLWVAGINASEGQVDNVRQRHRNISPYIGAEFAINEDWFGGAYLQVRRFLDSAREWDFEELNITASHVNGLSGRISYSPDYYATGASSFAIESQYQHTLSEPFYLAATAGYFDLQSEIDYFYANVKFGARYKQYSAAVSYQWVSESVFPSPVGRVESPGIVFEVLCKCF